MHASIVEGTMDSIFVENLMIRIRSNRTRLSLKKQGNTLQVEVTLVEDVLMVVGIIRAKGIMKGTSLESQKMPVIVGLSVLMEFGWLFVATVRPGVALPMPTLLVFMMLLF